MDVYHSSVFPRSKDCVRHGGGRGSKVHRNDELSRLLSLIPAIGTVCRGQFRTGGWSIDFGLNDVV